MIFKLLKQLLLPKPKEVSFDASLIIKKEWESIDTLLKQGGPAKLTQALISADRSLDIALKELVAGQTLGERLKNAKPRFRADVYTKLWQAHKLRNNLVHEALFEVPHFAITEAINDLREGLKFLKQTI
jgi:hypothetical protein